MNIYRSLKPTRGLVGLISGIFLSASLVGCGSSNGSTKNIVTPPIPNPPTMVENYIYPDSGYSPLKDTVRIRCTASDGIKNYSFESTNGTDSPSINISQSDPLDTIVTLKYPGTYQNTSKCTSASGQTTSKQSFTKAEGPTVNPDYIIVFSGSANNNDDVYKGWIRRDSLVYFKRLTTEPLQDLMPVSSPDGSQLAYISNQDSSLELYTMNADGSNPKRLTDIVQAFYPDWCSNNKIIYSAIDSSYTGVEEINSDGTGKHWIVKIPFSGYYIGPESCSPDGSKVVYGDTDGLNIISSSGGTSSLLVKNATLPAWSPDGSKILYSLNTDWNIYSIDVGTKVITQLTKGGGENLDPQLSPDGKKIVFSRNFQLWMMNSDGSSQIPLADSTMFDFSRNPDFIPQN